MFLSCHHPSNYLSILQYSSLSLYLFLVFFFLSLVVSVSLCLYPSIFLSSCLSGCLPAYMSVSVSLYPGLPPEPQMRLSYPINTLFYVESVKVSPVRLCHAAAGGNTGISISLSSVT